MKFVMYLLIASLLCAGCIGEETTVPEPEEPSETIEEAENISDSEPSEPTEATQSMHEENGVIIEITFSKAVYLVGEEVDARYKVSYSGEPFENIVGYELIREGYQWSGDGYSQTSEPYDSGSMGAGEISEAGFSSGDSFTYPGTYTYTIMVYDCEDVIAEFEHCDMSDINKRYLKADIEPRAEYSRSIKVIGN